MWTMWPHALWSCSHHRRCSRHRWCSLWRGVPHFPQIKGSDWSPEFDDKIMFTAMPNLKQAISQGGPMAVTDVVNRANQFKQFCENLHLQVTVRLILSYLHYLFGAGNFHVLVLGPPGEEHTWTKAPPRKVFGGVLWKLGRTSGQQLARPSQKCEGYQGECCVTGRHFFPSTEIPYCQREAFDLAIDAVGGPGQGYGAEPEEKAAPIRSFDSGQSNHQPGHQPFCNLRDQG